MDDHFYLIFVSLSLVWMLHLHAWFQNKGKLLVWSKCYNQFGIYPPSCVSPLEPQQSNLSNPKAYS